MCAARFQLYFYKSVFSEALHNAIVAYSVSACFYHRHLFALGGMPADFLVDSAFSVFNSPFNEAI